MEQHSPRMDKNHISPLKPSNTNTMTASELRRANKPLMEKRRRARINESLNELKTLVLKALQKDASRYSKLEKADVLEMTVKHLRQVQRQNLAVAMTTDCTVLDKYRSGFNECADEISRYMSSIDGLDPNVRARLIQHMSVVMQRVNTMDPLSATQPQQQTHNTLQQHRMHPYLTNNPGTSSARSSAGSYVRQTDPLASLHVQIPSATQLSSIPGSAVNLVAATPGSTPASLPTDVTPRTSNPPTSFPAQTFTSNTPMQTGIQLIPSQLPNGQVFLIPTPFPTPASSSSSTAPSPIDVKPEESHFRSGRPTTSTPRFAVRRRRTSSLGSTGSTEQSPTLSDPKRLSFSPSSSSEISVTDDQPHDLSLPRANQDTEAADAVVKEEGVWRPW